MRTGQYALAAFHAGQGAGFHAGNARCAPINRGLGLFDDNHLSWHDRLSRT